MKISGKPILSDIQLSEEDKKFANKIDGKYYEASEEQINEAVQNAAAAFLIYRNVSDADKAIFLETIAAGIEAERNSLLQTAMRETHLAEARLNGEITRTVNQVKLFASLLKQGSWINAIIDTAQPERKPLSKPDIRQMQKAIGVIAVFGASNFPFAFSTAGGDTIAALAAGCTVVYKAHPAHPELSQMVADIIIKAAQKANMPGGIFSMIQASTVEASINLIKHPLVKAVAFTGSFKAGKAIYNAAAQREEPIPVYAEMGSTNPVFILPEIMQQKSEPIAKALAASNLLSAGQFCTNPGIVISEQSDEANNFRNIFSNQIKEANNEVMLNDSIFNTYNQHIQKISSIIETTASSKDNNPEKQNAATAYMFIVRVETFICQQTLHEEVFGPASIHVTANNKNELMRVAESLQGQLTITIWGTENDIVHYKELINYLELKAGRIIINGVPTGVEVTHAMMHGGPYPATTDSKFTSVGTNSIYRFTRPVCYQNFNEALLPEALQNNNPLKIVRMINGEYTNKSIV